LDIQSTFRSSLIDKLTKTAQPGILRADTFIFDTIE
jgi:hypothetical protein